MTQSKQHISYWLLTTEYPPFHGGGISTYCAFTTRMLSDRGYSVTVFVPDDTVNDYIVSIEDNISVVRFSKTEPGLHEALGHSAMLSYRFAQVVKRIIGEKGKPDIIEAQDYLGIAYYLLQLKYTLDGALAGVPVVLTVHSPAFLYLEYNKVATYKFPDFWTCEMEKQSLAMADAVLFPTSFIHKAITKELPTVHLPGDKIVPNPFRFKEVDPGSAGIQKGKIVYYGKLSPQKGSFELFACFKEIWDAGYRLTLQVIGDTDIVYHPERRTMGDIVKETYAKYIEAGLLQFVSKVRPEEADQYVSDAEVVVFPSVVDNLPYVVMEMMSRGKIVLASVQGGQREIIEDKVSGFLFDHSTKDHFKETLLAILAMPAEAIEKVSRHAVEAIRNKYAFDTVFPVKDRHIRELLAKDRGQTQRTYPFLHQEAFNALPVKGESELLSVVIPFYNMAATLPDTIESVRKCNYQPIEILVVDDGSTDLDSIEALRVLSEAGDVKVICKPHTGLADTRNYGAEKAKGRFLAFLDADDKTGPYYYEKAIRILKHYDNVFFVGSWVKYFGNSFKTWITFPPQPPYLLVHNPVNSSSLVYKKEAFLAAGANDEKLVFGLEDYDSVVNMVARGYNGVVIPEVHFHYRVRSGSVFRRLNREKLIFSYKYITEKNAAYFGKFAKEVMHLQTANGPGFLFDNPTQPFGAGKNYAAYNFAVSFIKKRPALKRLALKFTRLLK